MENNISKNSRKPKGMGSIQKKDNNKYFGRLRIAGYEPFYCTGKTEKEVQKN